MRKASTCGKCGSSDLSRVGACRPCAREATRRYRARHPRTRKPRGSRHDDLHFACEGCGKEVVVRGADRSQHQGRFCSMPCVWKAHTYDGNPRWLGGLRNYNGYKWVMLDPTERAKHTCAVRNGKYIPEHRLKAERAVGRCLRKGEVVHHINGNKLDNRNSNLLVCDHRYHMWLHLEMARRWQLEKFGPGVTGGT